MKNKVLLIIGIAILASVLSAGTTIYIYDNIKTNEKVKDGVIDENNNQTSSQENDDSIVNDENNNPIVDQENEQLANKRKKLEAVTTTQLDEIFGDKISYMKYYIDDEDKDSEERYYIYWVISYLVTNKLYTKNDSLYIIDYDVYKDIAFRLYGMKTPSSVKAIEDVLSGKYDSTTNTFSSGLNGNFSGHGLRGGFWKDDFKTIMTSVNENGLLEVIHTSTHVTGTSYGSDRNSDMEATTIIRKIIMSLTDDDKLKIESIENLYRAYYDELELIKGTE